ncbi:MAG TPA: hypothetical protein VG713_05240 [Pirellulales bacterium]|nr:hypothetical protein [Pirellulales bacterium]
MNSAALLIALSTVGIDYGWEPVEGGGIEYIVRIDERMFESMRRGGVVSSDLPPVAGGIRGYRVVVGDVPLPHEGEPLPQVQPQPSAAEAGPVLAPPQGNSATPAATPEPPKTFVPPTESVANAPTKVIAPKLSVDEPTSPSDVLPKKQEANSDHPWVPLMLTLLGLFASVGGNVYLAVVTWGQRSRFARMLSNAKPLV